MFNLYFWIEVAEMWLEEGTRYKHEKHQTKKELIKLKSKCADYARKKIVLKHK